MRTGGGYNSCAQKDRKMQATADAVEIWNGMDLYRTGSFGELGGGRDYSFNG